MGILNVTPDSFSDGGRYDNKTEALRHAHRMIAEGAHIIDIGGESTRPGHTQISVDEECSRIVPVIEALRQETDLPLSVDCYRSATAREAITAGADIINDIWGLAYDPMMAPLIAEKDVHLVLMHNRKEGCSYQSYPADVVADLSQQMAWALTNGINKDHIILDPGVGFAKDRQQDATIIHHLDILKIFDVPLLLGTSRKRLMGVIVGGTPADRDGATAATTVYGYMKGARIFRVHNVRANREALDVAMALERKGHGLH